MRKLLIIIGLISVVASCNNKRKLFEVSGKITNSTARKVYLQYLVWGAEKPIVVDSISLQKDGSFVLSTAYGNEESIYELVFDTTASVLLINDNPKLFVNIDKQNFKQYSINGSKASIALHDFLNEYSNAYPKLLATSQRLDTIASEKGITDSIKTVVKLEKAQQLEKVNTTITNAFKNTNSPALQYYLVAKAFATMPLSQIQELATIANTQHTSHSGLAFIKSIINKQVEKEKAARQAIEKEKQDTIAARKRDSAQQKVKIDSTIGKRNPSNSHSKDSSVKDN
ncbi:DUF4369 domain-containing protein [Parasediminibacterium paludis]|uniref:DUF4369 domain-containing protein n=1 Tax=Parasediminibacterium paludis TaxID=908966 RepID=A0ABV8Q1E2_9BACT